MQFKMNRVLRVPRIAIHKNLFASLLIHSIATIAFKALVMLPYINSGGNSVDSVLQKVRPLIVFPLFIHLV